MLEIVPVTLRQANEFVTKYHRHHKASRGHKFSIGVCDGEKLVGVCICGRPVSRYLDDNKTLEVNRLCTDAPDRKGERAQAVIECSSLQGGNSNGLQKSDYIHS